MAIASNAPALLAVVTSVSRKIVMDVAVAVAFTLKFVHELLVVLCRPLAGLVVPPPESTLTDTVALAEFVLNFPVMVYVVPMVHPDTVWYTPPYLLAVVTCACW
jgi:hypothetical protein